MNELRTMYRISVINLKHEDFLQQLPSIDWSICAFVGRLHSLNEEGMI